MTEEKEIKYHKATPPPVGRGLVSMTIEDAEHYTPEQRQAIYDKYPEHERDARIRGIPMMGEGRVFPYDEALLKIPPFSIEPHWAQIGCMDFGIGHPFGAALLAWDKDDGEDGTVYVTKTYRDKGKTPEEHCIVLNKWGHVPWAWPHDGHQREKGTGIQLKAHYANAGLQMLPHHAQFTDGTIATEAGIAEMARRMESATFKVFSTCIEFFDEYRLYHRKDGLIVKVRDDVLSAVRQGIMQLRSARPPRRKAGGGQFKANVNFNPTARLTGQRG